MKFIGNNMLDLRWLYEGDGNTKFFHQLASSNKKISIISSLEINGSLSFYFKVIEKHILLYYRDLLGSQDKISITFSVNIWSDIEKVIDFENSCLTAPFTVEKIHRVVFEMSASKAPGFDGFLMLFYQKYWDLIKADLLYFSGFSFLSF
jgi:hypothetical protein